MMKLINTAALKMSFHVGQTIKYLTIFLNYYIQIQYARNIGEQRHFNLNKCYLFSRHIQIKFKIMLHEAKLS